MRSWFSTRTALEALGFGLVLSSGNSILDQSPRFATQSQAAFAILSAVNPISVQRNREHGGSIYRNPDGTFSASEIVVEGNMTHAGMAPVIDTARAEDPGRYGISDFGFTMAGDWILTIRGILPNGDTVSVQRTTNVVGRVGG